MTINPIIQDFSIVSNAQTIIDYTDEIKNSQIDDKLGMLFETLFEACNSKPLRAFPVKSSYEPIDKIGFQIRSDYRPDLKFSEIPRFIIDSLRLAESHVDDTRCLDALCVLRDYCNIIVYSIMV